MTVVDRPKLDVRRPQRLRVAIDARVTPGVAGGVAQFILSLIHGLGALNDGPEDYCIIVDSPQQVNWLRPFLGPNQRFIMKTSSRAPRDREILRRALEPLRPAARYVRRLMNVSSGLWPEIPVSDGSYEALGCDVIHLTFQRFILCALPIVYNPHDLQHLHYPQFFSPATIAWRETMYPAGCRLAHTVAVGSHWVKNDVVDHYRISPNRVQVVPQGPQTQLYREPTTEDLAAVRQKYGLEQPFALYPAVTWPHKNHLGLLEALAHLRTQRGLIIRLVCPGALHEEFWPRIEARIEQLELRDQVKFLGFIPDEDLRAIYRLASFLVAPTLFEATSLPIFDAWLEGLPVTCSNVTALPDLVMDAALLFDPRETESIADALAALATNADLCQELRNRGRRRLKDFDGTRTAKAYRAVYRRAAGHALTEEDRWLLGWDWMREPHKEMVSRAK